MNKTETKGKVTERPWNLHGNRAWSDSCKDRGDVFTCRLATGTHIPENQNEINAAHIVKCVNSHEELLEACRLMLIEHEKYNIQFNQTSDTPGMALGKAAISKAEGGAE